MLWIWCWCSAGASCPSYPWPTIPAFTNFWIAHWHYLTEAYSGPGSLRISFTTLPSVARPNWAHHSYSTLASDLSCNYPSFHSWFSEWNCRRWGYAFSNEACSNSIEDHWWTPFQNSCSWRWSWKPAYWCDFGYRLQGFWICLHFVAPVWNWSGCPHLLCLHHFLCWLSYVICLSFCHPGCYA